MNNKITRKLILYFLLIVVSNSLITGGVLVFLGQKAYVDSYKADLLRRAENIAHGISNNMDIFSGEEHGAAGQARKGLGKNAREMRVSPKYINWMDEVLDGNIWLIYKTDRVFQRATADIRISYEDLSPHEKRAIDEAFEGKAVTTESFDNIFEEGTLSAVAPLKNKDGSIYGAILIHENISLAKGFINSALYIIIISVLVGMLIAFVLVLFFARRFISPINSIDIAVKQMTDGDYIVKTNVLQDDEIGKLAQNIDELALRLEKSRIESENLDNMRNDFISNISHELKTPVTVMKSSLEGLVSGVINDNEIEDYHNLLYKEISVLERLVADLMELNSLKNLSFPMNFNEEDLISILKDAVRSQRILAQDKGIELQINTEHAYHMIDCDYTRLRQMFITVINNAIKYSSPNEKVIIKEYADGDNIKIQVINKGKAIDTKDMEHIFTSFYRGNDTPEKGFGLGLTIAKEIANRHNIDINVVSGENDETVFEFVI